MYRPAAITVKRVAVLCLTFWVPQTSFLLLPMWCGSLSLLVLFKLSPYFIAMSRGLTLLTLPPDFFYMLGKAPLVGA
jgi:hypothetical protein